MKTTKAMLFGAAVIAAFTPTKNVRADNLAKAAAKASALVNRPIAASPHALEEFPWLLRGYQPPGAVRPPVRDSEIYHNNLAVAAAKASALVNRPILASPHGLEEFPLLLRGSTEARQNLNNGATQTEALSPTGRASALVNRPIVSSTHRGDYP